MNNSNTPHHAPDSAVPGEPQSALARFRARGLPMRLQLFGLIMVFIVVSSVISFYTNQQFILRDKKSSLRELQILRIEQVRSKIEGRIETLKGTVLESALRLLDTTRARPDLNPEDWQYLIAGTNRWVAPVLGEQDAPPSAAAGAELVIELSADKEWLLWSQSIEVAQGNQKKVIPVQAKFRAALVFRSIEDLRDGALNLVLVRRQGPKAYDLVWGNSEGLENLQRIDDIDADVLGQATTSASREIGQGASHYFVAWGSAQGTPWVALSSVEQSTLVAGLRHLVAEQIFWIFTVILLAVIISIWFARRFSRPIETLVDASKHLETGDFSTRVSPEGPLEMQSLGAAFNHMGQALEDRENALRAAQDALIQNEKLAALGTLSAGIAHEVKNPLAGILGNADLLAGALKAVANPKAQQYVETIRKETKRCREIIDSLMRFSRQDNTTVEKVQVDLELVAWDSVNLVEHSLNMQGFQILKSFPDDMPVVMGTANQIEQVLLNMLQNAGHAMEASGGKNITIGLSQFANETEATAGGFIALAPEHFSGPIARIWIKDEGTGMSPEIQRRIFEPFFTTKEAGKGTGLGLAVTMGILADHQVRLSIDSAVGQGTTFYIDFAAVGPRSAEFKNKVAKMREKAQGGEQSEFDVGSGGASAGLSALGDLPTPEDEMQTASRIVAPSHSHDDGIDLGILGDDKPIALFEEGDSELAAPPVEKTVTGFSIRKPKAKR